MRRIPYALAALLALTVATPSHATTCNLLVDQRGDGRSTIIPGMESDQLDILSADIASGSTTVVVVLRVASLDPDPRMSGGVKWAVGWALAPTGPHYGVTLRRPTLSGTYVADASGIPVTYAVDVPAATITWTLPRTSFPELATPGTATFQRITASTSPLFANADAAATHGTYLDQTPSCVPAA
ncbi:MAG TPA: hypothetical protein VNQ77_08125 [Frankiaceae bacterium]|nr:hypothetical protein [Frankiaceae bacterium]